MEGFRKGIRVDRGADPEPAPLRRRLEPAGDREDAPGFRKSDESSGAPSSEAVLILIPAFNDWASLAQLLPRLDSVLAEHGVLADVLIVDDGSTIEPDAMAVRGGSGALKRVDVLRLRRNLGHQRAIAIGLAYVEDCLRPGVVVVMDGDGEDDPADVPRLLDRLKEEGDAKIVFAERSRRSESLGFRFFYWLFKLLHWVLIGKGVRVGNYQRDPAAEAVEPGRGGRALESLRGRRVPITAALLHDSDRPGPALQRPVDNELRIPGDARIECDLGL